ncbi:MAG: hypothetical protein C0616_15270 [Desulfuromonas sp.]|nr:MAG: hypothetical protein C0616_15270 [Desulfuromonas sp.]
MRIVTIKFRTAGKRYDFNALDFELHSGDEIIVETDRGRALGTVVQDPRDEPEHPSPEKIKNVIRLANEDDLKMAEVNSGREKEAFDYCQKRIAERGMEMKLVRAEYLYDGSKILFYFTADGRVDFRELVRDLAHHFHTRIEMRQIGVRDEAKLTGGIGICGRELCCCSFLTEFNPVSVKMAKEQGLALNPNKISGQCGRLLCCLSYEFKTYCDLKKGLPRSGKRIEFDGRQVDILDVNIIGQKITIGLGEGKRETLTAEQFRKGKLTTESSGEKQQQPEQRPPRPRNASKPGAPSSETEGKSQQGDRRKKKPRPQPRPEAQQDKQAKPPETKSESETKPRPKRRRRGRRRPKPKTE